MSNLGEFDHGRMRVKACLVVSLVVGLVRCQVQRMIASFQLRIPWVWDMLET